ncbi:MFS transporter [Streptomyces sp. NPDC059092]|uniref:MFS transporter n=1 Tax=Streptomyces sp. NPDC059092 TaxID=3346725 RepID=UPI0036B563D6
MSGFTARADGAEHTKDAEYTERAEKAADAGGSERVRAESVTARLPDGFRWFWFGQTMSGLGDRLTAFTVQSVAILGLGASGAQVGILSATGWLAYPALGLVAGVALAHVRRKGVMVAAELVRFAAFVSVPVAALAGRLTLTHLVVAVAVAGAATVFFDIGGQSYLPSLVGREQLVAANSRLSGADSLTKLAGPALAGVVFGVVGPTPAAALAAAPFLLSAAARAPVRAVEKLPVRPYPREPVWARVGRELRFVRDHPLLRLLVGRAALRGFGTGAVDAVLLLFAYRGLGLSSVGGGLLMASGAVGALAGAVLASRIIGRFGTRRALLLTGLEGVSWLAVPLCLLWTPAAVPVLVLVRSFSAVWLSVWGVLDASLRQALAPPGRQSTVHAVTRTLSFSTVPLGSLAGGLAGGGLSAWLGWAAGLGVVIAAGGLLAAASVLLFRKEPLLNDDALMAPAGLTESGRPE